MNKLAYQFVGVLVNLPVGNRWHPQMGASDECNKSTIYKAVASIQGKESREMLQYPATAITPTTSDNPRGSHNYRNPEKDLDM